MGEMRHAYNKKERIEDNTVVYINLWEYLPHPQVSSTILVEVPECQALVFLLRRSDRWLRGLSCRLCYMFVRAYKEYTAPADDSSLRSIVPSPSVSILSKSDVRSAP